jgi:predicted O-methyltransferase YrrM
MEVIYRQLQSDPELRSELRDTVHLQHPLFAWLGLRPVIAQHTREENEALRRWALGKRTLVEIGVAEGASAVTVRQVMHSSGILYLIDPFHMSRLPLVNSVRRLAKRTVSESQNGRVVWIEDFSFRAVREWTTPIDFLFLDGNHSEDIVRQDWIGWHHFLRPEGIVAFHDARTFEGGWTSTSDGPVKVVNEMFRSRQMTGWQIVDEVHSLVVVRRCH